LQSIASDQTDDGYFPLTPGQRADVIKVKLQLRKQMWIWRVRMAGF
jgi:hypothetical protein